jgi:uncharacterized protein YdiU (UPF0061 family)
MQPIAFDNSYAALPDRFFAALPPTPVAAPRLIALNRALALELGGDPAWLEGPEGLAMLAGNAVRPGPGRSPRPMPGTSSAISSHSLAMAGRSCWAR